MHKKRELKILTFQLQNNLFVYRDFDNLLFNDKALQKIVESILKKLSEFKKET